MADAQGKKTVNELINQQSGQSTSTKSATPSFFDLCKISIYIVAPLLTAFLAMTAAIMLALIPIALIPTVVLYWYYQRITKNSASQVKGSKLLTVYLLSGTIGTLAVVIVQGILTYLAGFIIFGSDIDTYMKEFGRTESELEHADPEVIARRAHMAAQPQYWIFMFILMFDIVGFTEELLKYISLPLTLKYLLKHNTTSQPGTEGITSESNTVNSNDEDQQTFTDPRQPLLSRPILEKAYVPIVVAATLGFSTLENIGFMYGAAVNASEPPLRLLQTVLERLFIGTPGHVLTALYISTATIQRDFGTTVQLQHTSNITVPLSPDITIRFIQWLRILAVPIVFHGLFDFILLATSALNGNIGWVHPRRGPSLWIAAAGILALQVTLAFVVRRRWIRLGIHL